MRSQMKLLLLALLFLAPAAYAVNVPIPIEGATLNLGVQFQTQFLVNEAGTPDGTNPSYDVFVRRTSLLEQWLPFTRPDGATLVPEQDYLPQGTSESQHVNTSEEEIRRSELIAPAVALKRIAPGGTSRRVNFPESSVVVLSP